MRATKYEDGIMCVDDVSNYILSALTSNIVDLAKIQN